MRELINLALRRNFFFPTAEIYNGYAGFYDFGDIGLKIKNNLIDAWRKYFLKQFNYREIDGSVILPKPVFEASGHLKNFYDPVIKCLKCNSNYRADKLLEEYDIEINENTPLEEIDKIIKEKNIKCPKCKGSFDKAFRFNMMFKLKVGVDDKNIAYLRPEACQNIFLDFNRIYKNARTHLPFGIAQVGKAFRNEIAPRNALIRLRELTHMDLELFFDPENNFDYENIEIPVLKEDKVENIKINDCKYIKYDIEKHILSKVVKFFKKIGINKLRFRYVSSEERPFYSLATWDLEAYVKDIGWVEIVANNYRSDYDLKNHAKFSKKKLEIMDNDKKILPHIFEVSMGLDRIFYVLLAQNLTKINDKYVLKLKPFLQAYDFAIFPLVKKDGLNDKAKEIYNILDCGAYNLLYDEKGSIGKRYARIDELGIRYAITIDYQTLEDNTVTLRDAYNTKQIRLKIEDLNKKLFELKYNNS